MDDMEKWVSKWEEASKKEAFTKPSEPEPEKKDKFFDSFHSDEKLNENKYWSTLAKMGRKSITEQETLVGEPTIEKNPLGSKILRKQRDLPKESDLAEKGAELANTANPVMPDSRGADWRNHVTPEWSDGIKIREIANMYRNLYDLQCKLNQNPKFGAFGEDSREIKNIQAQIDEIKYNLDKLSDDLSPNFVDQEQS